MVDANTFDVLYVFCKEVLTEYTYIAFVNKNITLRIAVLLTFTLKPLIYNHLSFAF